MYVYIRVPNSQAQAAQYYLDKGTLDQCHRSGETNTRFSDQHERHPGVARRDGTRAYYPSPPSVLANTRHSPANSFSFSKVRLASATLHFDLSVYEGRLHCMATNPMRWKRTRAEQVLASFGTFGASKDPGHVLRRGHCIILSLIRRLSQGCIGTPHYTKHHM